MSNLAVIEKQMRHTASKDAKREWRGEDIYTTCERCNIEVHGSYIFDEDRGDIFVGWFHNVINSKGNTVGRTHCLDEFISELQEEYNDIMSKFVKK